MRKTPLFDLFKTTRGTDGETRYSAMAIGLNRETCYVMFLTEADGRNVDKVEDHYRCQLDDTTILHMRATGNNDAVVRYTLGKGHQKIFASRYKLHLPSEAELRKEWQRELKQLRLRKG